MPNYDLKPQIQRQYEFGTYLSFFNNRASIDFAWYKKNTFNQLLQLSGVPETGYNTLYINAGNVQNQGAELLVNYSPVREKDFGLDLSLNLGHNASKIIKFYPGITRYQNEGNYEGAEVDSYQGGAFGELEVQGNSAFQIDKKTGYPIIQNAPHVTNTNPGQQSDYANYQYSYYSSDTLINMGKVEPSLTGGINATFRYKNFSLFAQVDGRFGGMVYSESYTYAMSQGSPKASLAFRDKAHGGVARIDAYTGQTVYNGAVPNAVFAAGQTSLINGQNIGGMTFKQAYQQGLVEPWFADAYYDGGPGFNGTYDWENGINYNGAISKNTWLMLRQISLSYRARLI